MNKELVELVNQKVAEAKKEVAKEFWKELCKVIEEGRRRPPWPWHGRSSEQLSYAYQSAYNEVYEQMRNSVNKYGVKWNE